MQCIQLQLAYVIRLCKYEMTSKKENVDIKSTDPNKETVENGSCSEQIVTSQNTDGHVITTGLYEMIPSKMN